tara:strand:+ start:931 stop:1362 length:432 start_codon:yes stop_codon:yes gene_type:complete
MNIAELATDLYTNLLFIIKKVSQKNNISSSQLLCLYAIPSDGILQSDLAKILCLDLSTLSRNLDKLIIHNLVHKKTSPSDYRKQNIFLTQSGESLYLTILSDLNAYFQQLDGWNNQNIQDLDILLANLTDFNWLLHKHRYKNV